MTTNIHRIALAASPIPTPRWSIHDAKEWGVQPPSVPATAQGRAWT